VIRALRPSSRPRPRRVLSRGRPCPSAWRPAPTRAGSPAWCRYRRRAWSGRSACGRPGGPGRAAVDRSPADLAGPLFGGAVQRGGLGADRGRAGVGGRTRGASRRGPSGPAAGCGVDGFATPVRPYLRAVAGRRQLDRWAERLVGDVRAGVVTPPLGSVLQAVSTRPVGGRRLPPKVAAVELLNFVRPTVAVAWFIAFAGLALAEHPEWRERARRDPATARAWLLLKPTVVSLDSTPGNDQPPISQLPAEPTDSRVKRSSRPG
jgi:hypothetical protein